MLMGYSEKGGWKYTENAKPISVKVTHKLFSKKYEKVRDL